MAQKRVPSVRESKNLNTVSTVLEGTEGGEHNPKPNQEEWGPGEGQHPDDQPTLQQNTMGSPVTHA